MFVLFEDVAIPAPIPSNSRESCQPLSTLGSLEDICSETADTCVVLLTNLEDSCSTVCATRAMVIFVDVRSQSICRVLFVECKMNEQLSVALEDSFCI